MSSTVLGKLRFNEQGLIPVIAQQHDTGEVLMMAWMSRESLMETLETGRVCYWSRTKGRLWRKGDTSGHVQRLIQAQIDCDGDTLLVLVDQKPYMLLPVDRSARHSNQRDALIAVPLRSPRR